MSGVWNKEKSESPNRIWTYNLPTTADYMLINSFSHQSITCFAILLQKTWIAMLRILITIHLLQDRFDVGGKMCNNAI